MRANYQQLVKAHQQVARNLGNEKEDENSKISKIYLWKGADSDGRPCSWRDKIPSVSGRLDHLKCTLLYTEECSAFQTQVFMDSLFQSFNQQVSMHNFAELSGCVFSWIEEQCKPGDLQVPKKRSIVFLLPFTMSSCKDLIYSILRRTGNGDGERSQSPQDPAYQSSR